VEHSDPAMSPAAARQFRGVASATLICLLSMIRPVCAQPSGAVLDANAAWFAAYQRDSRLVQIARERSLNVYCLGSGSPTVILESGIGGDAYDWRAVQGKLAKLTQTCAYDRAGLGRSTPGPLPRDTRAEVADLEALLKVANIRPPYLLVGHSMGGFNVRLFASRHPNDVAGLVLVDPAVENQVPIMEAALPAGAENDRRSVAFVRSCDEPNPSPGSLHAVPGSRPTDFPQISRRPMPRLTDEHSSRRSARKWNRF